MTWDTRGNPEKRPSFVKRHPVTTVFIILGILALLFMGGCVALIGGAANEVQKSIESSTSDEAQKDLTSNKLRRDCAVEGEACTVFADYVITNHSDKKMTYDIAADVVGPDNTRLGTVNIYEFDVKPGQTVKGSEVVDLDYESADLPPGAKLKNLLVTRY